LLSNVIMWQTSSPDDDVIKNIHFINFLCALFKFYRKTNDVMIYSGYISGKCKYLIKYISCQNEITKGLLNSVTSMFIYGT